MGLTWNYEYQWRPKGEYVHFNHSSFEMRFYFDSLRVGRISKNLVNEFDVTRGAWIVDVWTLLWNIDIEKIDGRFFSFFLSESRRNQLSFLEWVLWSGTEDK